MTARDPYAFRANDPFPLLDWTRAQSQYAKFHADACDAHLGFDFEANERRFRERMTGVATRADFEDWRHLAPRVYLTTYLELRAVLEELAPPLGATVVDLGCAYARIPFVLSHHFPGRHFVGVEAVRERAEESRRVAALHALTNVRIDEADLTDPAYALPRGDAYFAYDIGTQGDVDVIVDRLFRTLADAPFRVAARGERTHRAFERALAVHRNARPGSTGERRGPNLAFYRFASPCERRDTDA